MTGTRAPLKIIPTRRTTSSIYFHHVRHPAEMAEPRINAFLPYLAVKEHVDATMIYTLVLNKGGMVCEPQLTVYEPLYTDCI